MVPTNSEIIYQLAMKITRLEVENFRAVRRATLPELGDTVLIAGPNGCGKSCLFDAIRLLKSTYGGYQPNEWQQWFGEFQINVRDEVQLLRLFHDRSRPVRVATRLVLSDREKSYLREHALEICTALLWQQVSPERSRYGDPAAPSLASELRKHRHEVDARALTASNDVLQQIEAPHLDFQVYIHPNLDIEPVDCTTAEVVFSTYEPEHIGVIDFHGSHRDYQRERLGGINLDIQSSESQLRQHALYNAAQKYKNIKSQMAAHYIRDLLMKKLMLSQWMPAHRLSILSMIFSKPSFQTRLSKVRSHAPMEVWTSLFGFRRALYTTSMTSVLERRKFFMVI